MVAVGHDEGAFRNGTSLQDPPFTIAAYPMIYVAPSSKDFVLEVVLAEETSPRCDCLPRQDIRLGERFVFATELDKDVSELVPGILQIAVALCDPVDEAVDTALESTMVIRRVRMKGLAEIV